MKALSPIPLLAVMLLLACGGNSQNTAEDRGKEQKVALVRTAVVESEQAVDVAQLACDLRPRRRATLAAEIGGVIEALPVRLGDPVSKGQVVARIDTRALEQQLAEATALHDQAVDRAKRAESLFERRSITEQQKVDAVAGKNVSAARLAGVRLALEKAQIRAPWSGRVAKRHAEEGDFAIPGQPLVELVEVDRIIVAAAAPATDVPHLDRGTPVSVTVDVLPGEVFEGEVIRLGAELDPSTRTLAIEAELPNPDGKLRPGLYGRLEFPRETLPNALLVPLSSVVDFETLKVVYVVEDGFARRRDVVLGPHLGERVVIAQGLEAGDRVIVRGLQSVADGQPVKESIR